jgi:PAS domain S-box-containing protein
MTGISRGGNKFISSFVLSAGFVTVFFGLLVLLGRVTGISSLIMLFPNTAPIQFNTALAIAFSGVALILAQRGHRKHSAFFGGLVAAIGAVTIVEYFLGTFSGIDQFFVRPFLSAASPYPGRMAPDTALCFFSIGSAVLILNSRVISRFSGLFASIFGLVVIFVSGMAIRSHLLSASAAVSDLHTAYTWGSHNRMTVQGAVQILIAGLALLAHLLERDHRQYGKTETFVPLGSSALCLFAAMLIWQGLMKVDIENIHALTTSQAGGVVRLIEHSLEERLLGVQRLGRRWDYSGKPPKNQWIDDVSHYYQDFPGFQALSWADSQYHVQWVYPLAGNEKVIGFNFHTGAERIEAIDEGLKTRHSVVTKVITLKQGGEGFGILTPLFPRGKFDGFIGAGFRITDLVGKLINPEGYELYIRDANHSIYASGNIDAQYRRELSAEVPLNFHEMKWTVEMVPTPATLQRQGSNLALTVFLVGLIASMLIGTIARLSIISGSSKRRAWAALEWRRAIMDSTSQMIIATNAQGTIVTFNPAAEKGLGYVAEELIGKETPLIFRDPDEVQNRFDLIHSQSGKAPKSAFEALVEKARKGVIEEQEATFVRKDGRKFPVALTVTALHGANHAITGYLGVAVDITEKRQVRIALEKAKEEALESARAKAAFLANMSHEIRTPLNGIIGMADLLMETPLEDQQRKFAKIIQDSGSNLLTIINDILDFSKVEAGKMSLECVDFRLTAVIEGQVDLLATRAREKEISLMTYIDPKISAFV